MVDRLGPPNRDPARAQQSRQPVELAFGLVDQRWIDRPSAKPPIRAAFREIGGEARLIADLGGAARGADDRLLERIPLIPAGNPANRAYPGAFGRAKGRKAASGPRPRPAPSIRRSM
jgi:hypothetical protein